jgi:hypothetical protein
LVAGNDGFGCWEGFDLLQLLTERKVYILQDPRRRTTNWP